MSDQVLPKLPSYEELFPSEEDPPNYFLEGESTTGLPSGAQPDSLFGQGQLIIEMPEGLVYDSI
jgi:hypothetical protein